MGIRPATPGTLVVAAACVLLALVSASVPINKSIFFLKANVDVSIDGFNIGGDVKLGTFGYCIAGSCTGTSLGYTIDADALLSISGTAGNILGSLPDDLIHWLTYALVIHPVAAGFAGLATICGLLSHIREFSITGFTTCFAVFGAVLSLLAFVFDMVAFSIAKSRINGVSDDNLSTAASLGNAIWMTLAAFILLLFSGCFFSFGRCVIRSKANRKSDHDAWKPTMDPTFNTKMREDGMAAEKWRKDASTGGSSFRRGKEGGLPAFAEFADQEEHVPLTHFNNEEWGRDDEERVSGVGYGAPRQPGQASGGHTPGSYSNDYGANGYAGQYFSTPAPTPQHRQQSGSTMPPNASGFRSMYDGAAGQTPVPPVPQPTHEYSYSASGAYQQYPQAGGGYYASPPRSRQNTQPYASPPQAAGSLAYPGASSFSASRSQVGGYPAGAAPPPQAAGGSGYSARKQPSHEGSLPNPYGGGSTEDGHGTEVEAAYSPSSVYPPTEIHSQAQHGGRYAPSQPPSYST